jgi:hypothetical protein
MVRDQRLLGAVALFTASAVSGVAQAAIVRLYIEAAVLGKWESFSNTFGVKAPPNGPDVYCLDYCVADLPFIAGWIGIVCFAIGLALTIRSWWKPLR